MGTIKVFLLAQTKQDKACDLLKEPATQWQDEKIYLVLLKSWNDVNTSSGEDLVLRETVN